MTRALAVCVRRCGIWRCHAWYQLAGAWGFIESHRALRSLSLVGLEKRNSQVPSIMRKHMSGLTNGIRISWVWLYVNRDDYYYADYASKSN